MKTWGVSWSNGNITSTEDEMFMIFPTTQDATNYLNALNTTNYSLTSTDASSATAYINATGHAPMVYKDYVYFEGNPVDFTTFRVHEIQQQDNIVKVMTGRNLGA